MSVDAIWIVHPFFNPCCRKASQVFYSAVGMVEGLPLLYSGCWCVEFACPVDQVGICPVWCVCRGGYESRETLQPSGRDGLCAVFFDGAGDDDFLAFNPSVKIMS